MIFFDKTFKTTILFIIFLELLSFTGYYFPLINKIAFLGILFITLILALEKLEYGIYILLAELFVGSKGYLFYFESGGVVVSLRIGLFLVIISVWLFYLIKSRYTEIATRIDADKQIFNFLTYKFKNLSTSYWLLFLAIAWGIIYGILRGNNFSNVFFDANAWLYFLLVFPIFEVIKNEEQIKNIFQIFLAGLVDIILKSLFSLWIFSHGFIWFGQDLYRWLRTSGVGEVTPVTGNFYRVFFQSQIYALLGFFIFLCLMIGYWWNKRRREDMNIIPNKVERSEESHRRVRYFWDFSLTLRMTFYFLLSTFCFLIIIISFSRSFWLAFAGGLVILFIYLIFITKESWRRIFKFAGIIIIIAILDLGFLYLFVTYPKTGEGVPLASLIGERISASEAAGFSRINQLEPLFRAIIKHPVIGSGFGTTVTYKSADPRILAISPKGEYTTYAFEWGYLDIWLKIGLAGLLIYLGLIWQLLKKGWGRMMKYEVGSMKYEVGSMKYLNLGFLLGLVGLLLVNIFTPYLNHPLGIGYLILFSVILNIADKEVLTKS